MTWIDTRLPAQLCVTVVGALTGRTRFFFCFFVFLCMCVCVWEMMINEQSHLDRCVFLPFRKGARFDESNAHYLLIATPPTKQNGRPPLF